jgi:integrase/recombinase XerD
MGHTGRKKPKPIVGDPSDLRGMAHLMGRYLEWMQVRNYSERTVEAREQQVTAFIKWCEERAIARPSEVTKPMIERYQRWLYHYRKEDGRPLSLRRQYVLLIGVRGFFKWLARHNHILYNPASDLEMPRREKRLPRHVLSAAEAEAVINQADTRQPLGVRDRAMMETLYSTGMRRMEIINLKLYDLDVERGTVVIRQGKGKKDRMIPIGDRALGWIDRYLSDVRPELVAGPDEATLFLTNRGEEFTPVRMTGMIHQYVKTSGIGKQGSCHLFRHAMATLMLENGADIRFIQQMLGHASMETTQIYTQVSIRKLKEIHTATHPAKLRVSGVRDQVSESPAGEAADALLDESQPHTEPSATELLSSLAAEAAEEEL